jgi:DNA polymerase-1
MPETLYLIDGYAQIFRSYFAIRGGMTSSVTGEPTQAVFGFTGMLLKLFSVFNPHYVVVAIDAPGKTFRDEMYPEYKATRNPTPEDLTAQIPRVLEMIELFGIPAISKPGLEADDVIATIVQRILNNPEYNDVQIRIVSKDKDLEQLLGDRVAMFDIHTDTTIDVPTLLANKGVTPEQVIDVLALTGDTVDNVPGVPGIGPKTAVQLIQEFGSIDGILANLDKIKGKKRENLEAAAAHLPLSRALVTLMRDAEFDFSLEDARVSPPRLDKIIPIFQQLGFNRYQSDVRRLAGELETAPAATNAKPSPPPAFATGLFALADQDDAAKTPIVRGDYQGVTTQAQLDDLMTTLREQKMLSVDTETTGLERDAKLCGISVAWKPGHGVYIPTLSPKPEEHLSLETVLAAMRPILEDPSIPKCGHNLKFDAGVLLRNGISLQGAEFDTMLAGQLVAPGQSSYKLDHMAQTMLGYTMIPISEIIGEGDLQLSIDKAPLEKVVTYAAEDADIALRLTEFMLPQLEEVGMSALIRDVESPLAVILAQMERNGITCDPAELLRQGDALAIRVEELRAEVLAAAGCEFHLDSPRQLAEVLFEKLGLASGKKTKTGYSTSVDVLEKLVASEDKNDPRTSVPRLILEYRQLTKLISTYMGNLRDAVHPETGRIHSSFHQLMTATGRLASQNPNLQNIPVRSEVGRQVRKAFVAPQGYRLICADYSQVELRLLAHLSEDEALIDAFARDQDIHTAVAAQVFGVSEDAVTREQRGQAKTINFGIIYGVTAYGLARRIDGLEVDAAIELISGYKKRFSGIDRFLQKCCQEALEQGYVATLLGRRRAIPEISSSNGHTRSLGERLAINSVVQGSAADLIKVAMVNVQKRITKDQIPTKLLLQIHDELIFESPAELADEHAALIRDEMERSMDLRVPLRAEAGIGADWMSAK